ncbi:hypothetical protein AAT19DRAFT_15633 [Rhodotorula toruloides]|uniref:Uncharacterized protein n=1 Tax=Rhodotorula toruloides TaxID=5286 RepID=A0A2T0A830_RHOTO|nr:hypothetical protein AAT19DRAFT_15633 [Rhodotorula toruloides]
MAANPSAASSCALPSRIFRLLTSQVGIPAGASIAQGHEQVFAASSQECRWSIEQEREGSAVDSSLASPLQAS